MEFRLRRASGAPIFQFRQFLISPKFIPAYATARDCTKCIHEPPGGCKYVLHPPWGVQKNFRASREFYTPKIIITPPLEKIPAQVPDPGRSLAPVPYLLPFPSSFF